MHGGVAWPVAARRLECAVTVDFRRLYTAAPVADAARAAGFLFAVGVVGAAPIVTTLAAWLPSLAAAMADPASILSEE